CRHLRCKRSALPTELIALCPAKPFKRDTRSGQGKMHAGTFVFAGQGAETAPSGISPPKGSERCLTGGEEVLNSPSIKAMRFGATLERGCSSVG
ncbi:hypothetical protein B9T16_30180, partial [Arthrospira sp. PCC 8006]